MADNGVATISGAYKKMAPIWSMINCLIGGTADMREAGKLYLPQYPGESDANYKERKQRSVLYEAYAETSKKMANKPFSKPLVVKDIHASLKELIDDVDLQGNDLHRFSRAIFKDALDHGFTAMIADFPVVDTAQVQTKQDEDELKVRPYLIHVKAENIIAAYSEMVNGVEVLNHVRIRENMVVRNGFSEELVESIRVLEPGKITICKKIKDRWEQGTTLETKLNYIPMVIYYTAKESLCCARPPLLGLAYKNIEHFQSASDQRNCLTVARFPMLAASGVTSEEGKKVIGPRTLLKTADASGKFYYVEHSGAALNVGKQDLDDIKDEMTMMGIQLIRKKGAETATKTNADTEAQMSDLEAMVVDLEDALEEALEMLLDWLVKDGETSEAGDVEIFKDFSISASDGKDLDFLFKLRAAREISREAFMTEVKRRGVLSDSYDAEDDKELIDQEAPLSLPVAPSAKAPGGLPVEKKKGTLPSDKKDPATEE